MWLEIATGGGFALMGGFLAQAGDIWRDHSRSKVTRQDAANERKRVTLVELCNAAKIYREELATQQDLAASGEASPAGASKELRTARMNYEALLHRVNPRITEAFKNWENGAKSWANGDASIAQENALWATCMESSGHRLRELDAV